MTPPPRPNILVLTSTFPRWEGDDEPPFVYELTKRLSKTCEVAVLCPHAPKAKLYEHISGIQIYRFRYFIPKWERLAYEGGILANLRKNHWLYFLVPFFLFFELIAVIRLLRTSRFQAIHAHWIIPQGLIATLACMFISKPPIIICTSHGGDLFALSGAIFNKLKSFVIRRIAKLTVVSQGMRDYAASRYNWHDIEVIPMGVDLKDIFTPLQITREPCSLLFTGRLVEKKGVHSVIKALPIVLNYFPQAELLIAGDGPLKSQLQFLAQEIGVSSHIRFLGKVRNSELPDFYRRATIFIAPSLVAPGGDQEGLGLVFVEALGCACPVIASDLPVIRDVIIDGETGLVCKQNNHQDLAEKILYLLNNPEQCERLGNAGRAHVVKHFDWPYITTRYFDLFINTLSHADN